MARNPAGLASWSTTVVRRLCAVAAEPYKSRELYRRLSPLGGAPKGAVSGALNKWLREGRRIRAFDVMQFVKELRKYRRFDHALELMEWMDTKGMNMSYSNNAIRLDLVCRVEGVNSAEKYFSNLSEPAKNQLTYGALLNCYCIEKMEDKALALFEKIKEHNYAKNALPYNNIMTLYMRLGKPEKVPSVVQEMVDKNIIPNDFTHCILMNSYAALKDFESVDRVFNEIECKATKAKWPIYSNLASLYVAAGLSDKAASALKMLEENMDRGDRQGFHFLLSLYAGAGKLEDVNRVWSSLKSAFPTTLNLSYLTMLQSLSRLNDFDSLDQCFREWESGCLTYDIRLANIMFGAYLRRDMLKEAEMLWDKVISKGAEANFRTFEMYIDYYLNKQKIDLALKYFNDAVQKVKNQEWKPNKEKINSFLRYFEGQKDVDGAEAFCKSLKKLDCLDSDAYSSLLQTYMSVGKTEPSLNQQIQGRMELNVKTEMCWEEGCGQ